MDGASPEFRLFLEDVAGELFFFDHVAGGAPPEVHRHPPGGLSRSAPAGPAGEGPPARPFAHHVEHFVAAINERYGMAVRCTRSMGEIFTEQSADMLMEHQQPEQSWLTPGRPVTYHRSAFDVPGSDWESVGLDLAAAALAVVKAAWRRDFGGARRENAMILVLKRPS
jgi:hypothetical protein